MHSSVCGEPFNCGEDGFPAIGGCVHAVQREEVQLIGFADSHGQGAGDTVAHCSEGVQRFKGKHICGESSRQTVGAQVYVRQNTLHATVENLSDGSREVIVLDEEFDQRMQIGKAAGKMPREHVIMHAEYVEAGQVADIFWERACEEVVVQVELIQVIESHEQGRDTTGEQVVVQKQIVQREFGSSSSDISDRLRNRAREVVATKVKVVQATKFIQVWRQCSCQPVACIDTYIRMIADCQMAVEVTLTYSCTAAKLRGSVCALYSAVEIPVT